MAADSPAPIDLKELEQLLAAVEPAALLVAPRLLRRVIKRDRRLVGLGRRVPHARSYVLSGESLLACIDAGDLGFSADRPLPPTVLLLARPEPEELAAAGRERVLVRTWRLLFHARVHQVLAARRADGLLSDAAVRHRIQLLGPTEFAAARAVLIEENYLFPGRDLLGDYIEFAAVYLELRFFAPLLLSAMFPGLGDLAAVDALLAEDIDGPALFAATRLPGAPDPLALAAAAEREAQAPLPPPPEPTHAPSEARYRASQAAADRARGRGNIVRAAIRRMRAASAASEKTVRTARNAARAELNLLVDRLVPALGLEGEEAIAWRQVLPALLPAAATGNWPVEARLLYDLQKVAVDHERELYAADLVEWARSLGRRPVKRPLPEQREVLLLRHLRSAAARLPAARLPEEERRRLAELFERALARCEAQLRQRFRPQLVGVLDQVGLVPQNVPEKVARDKLVEGLLDRIIDQGFLTMGDLRDALSSSQLKLPDLGGVVELLRGDQLLRVNGRLARVLDGVYRRGEVYLRWLQRLSALAFGTVVGRLLMLYLVLPFGGGYVVVKGTEAMINEGLHFSEKVHARLSAAAFDEEWEEEPVAAVERVQFTTSLPVILVGLVLFALIHVPPFRGAVFRGTLWLLRALKLVLLDLPAAVLRWGPLRQLLRSRLVMLLSHYLLKPAVGAALVTLVFALLGLRRSALVPIGLAAFLAGNLFLNSRLGRALEESLRDAAALAWHRLGRELIPGAIRFILDIFRFFMEALDRAQYSIDELLRFRAGQGRAAFAAKAGLGLVWFLVAYLVRMNVVLWIEPTVNPVKHFPTVTVAAKLLLPILPVFYEAMEPVMGALVAGTLNGVLLVVLPGLAGFAVWELKENWRLYAANRPAALRPVMVGSHGETVRRLLVPGLHSGTVPKLYARLRRAERRALKDGHGAAARRHRAALHHVAEDVRHFLEREFLALLQESTFWRGHPLLLSEVELASHRIRAALHCPSLEGGPVYLDFEEHGGWLVAGTRGPGWLPHASPEAVQALTTALAGLYKLAGVELVREQLEARLPPGTASYEVEEAGLYLWGEEEKFYSLEGPALRFDHVEVPWDWWVAAWEHDRQGRGHPPLPFTGWRLLS